MVTSVQVAVDGGCKLDVGGHHQDPSVVVGEVGLGWRWIWCLSVW